MMAISLISNSVLCVGCCRHATDPAGASQQQLKPRQHSCSSSTSSMRTPFSRPCCPFLSQMAQQATLQQPAPSYASCATAASSSSTCAHCSATMCNQAQPSSGCSTCRSTSHTAAQWLCNAGAGELRRGELRAASTCQVGCVRCHGIFKLVLVSETVCSQVAAEQGSKHQEASCPACEHLACSHGPWGDTSHLSPLATSAIRSPRSHVCNVLRRYVP
jgi:hypothetical protein